MRVRRVVGVGLCVVDHFYVVDDLSLADERLRYDEALVTSGGMTGNALSQAAALGCRARAVSLLGDDEAGRLVRRTLRARGVDTRGLLLSPRAWTTVAVCLVSRRTGERRFLVADRRALERGAPDFDLSCIDAHTVLLVDGHFAAQALRAVKRARRVGATVVGDFHAPARARALLPWVDYPIVPEQFATAGGRSARELVAALARDHGGTPVVTQGGRGGVYWDGRGVRRFAARPVRVRDTTGAGDAFHGAFAAGLAHGLTLDGCLDLAARAAARCCTALGGAGALLRRAEVPALRAAASPAGRSRARVRRRPA